jgi:hypothetical protein
MMYVALVGSEHVESSFSLEELLGILDELGEDGGEDVVVWQGQKVVCVHHGPGRVTWLRPSSLYAVA